MEGFMKGFYSISDWVMRLMYINILWILFSFLGLILLGFFPATTAMFTVVRKWVLKQPEVPVFKTFWLSYKSEFLKSNVVGLIMVLVSFFLYSNIQIIQAITIPSLKLLYIPNVIMILIFALTLLYVFPVLAHFDVGIKGIIKNSCILMTINPIATFIMAVLSGTSCLIVYKFPGLFPFFSGSIPAYLLMFFSNYVFLKFDQNVYNSSIFEPKEDQRS